MPSAQGIRAGRAFVELFVDDSKLVRGLRRAQRRIQAWGASVRSLGANLLKVGAVAATPLAFAVKAASDMEETMNKFNVVFGENADAVKTWGDNFAGEVGRSKRQIADFLAGSQDLLVPMGFEPGAAENMSKQLTMLAVDLASFNNMADADVLRDLHAALTGSGEVMKKYGVIVSEAAVKQELLNQGIDKNNASEQQKAMARMAIIMRGTTAAQGDAIRSAGSWANQMKALQANISDAATEVGAALLPVVTPLLTKVSSVVKVVGQWIKQNSGLVVTIAKVAAVIAIAGAVFVALGTAISGLGFVLGGIASGITLLGTIFGAILSPVGLVTAAIVGLGAVLLTTTEAGGQVLAWLSEKFGLLKDTAITAFQGIAAALSAGDIRQAGEILWAALNVLWTAGTAELQKVWIGFQRLFTSVAADAVKAVMEIFNVSVEDIVSDWSALETAWVEVTSFLGNVWTSFVAGLRKGWNSAQNFISKGIVRLMGLFDESLDVEGAIAELDQSNTAANRDIDAETQAKLDAREQRKTERLATIESGRAQRQQQIEAFLNDGVRNSKFDEQLRAADEAVRQARAELREASRAAQTSKKSAEKAGGSSGKSDFPQLAGAGGVPQSGKASVVGTFSALAVRGFGAGSTDKKIADNTAETVKQLKKLNNKAATGGLSFN